MAHGALDSLRRAEVTRRHLKILLLLVVLLQFGFPVTEHGPVWGPCSSAGC